MYGLKARTVQPLILQGHPGRFREFRGFGEEVGVLPAGNYFGSRRGPRHAAPPTARPSRSMAARKLGLMDPRREGGQIRIGARFKPYFSRIFDASGRT